MSVLRRSLSILLGLCAVLPCSAKLRGQADTPPIVQLQLKPELANGVFPEGAAIRMKATLSTSLRQAHKGRLVWQLTAADKILAEKASPCEVAALTDTVVVGELKPPGAGFYFVEARFQAAGHPAVVARVRVGSDPEGIKRPLTARPDLERFWRQALGELRLVQPRYEVTRQPEGSTATRDLYLVEMRSLGDVRVRGWLEVPKKSGKHPALLRVPGYSASMRPVHRDTDMIIFSFNIRGHGNSQDDVSGEGRDYLIRGLDDKETYFYRGACADCVRAVDYLCTRDDVDQDRLAVWGGSQGGGMSWMTAALDPRIDACVADIPWLADWVAYFRLTDWPEMNNWVAGRATRTWKSTCETLSYFDTMNMAHRIKCPVLMRVGLQDRICPPSTSFATYNRIAGPKEYIVYPDAGHGILREHHEVAGAWLERVLQ